MAESGTQLTGVGLRRETPWGPLREPLFRSLWIAAVVSYTGTWMQNVGAGWLMTSLTLSPMLVGLVQAASSLPAFFFYIPAGALADIVDRRRLLIATQLSMVAAAAGLGVLTMTRHITPGVLLLFTFLMGIGAVMNDPAWQAITHEIVSEENFAPAIAVNSAGFNVARAIGPALGGLVIAALGAGTAFLLNAASFFPVIWFLGRWRRNHDAPALPAQRVMEAMRAGFKFARHSASMHSVLIRTAVFSLSAAALWAMLPLIAAPYGSIGYGALLGCFGAGALAGAAVLPYWRRVTSVDGVVALATIMYAAGTWAAGYVGVFWLHCLVLFVAGVGWILIVASLNVSAQTICPSELRARTLSIYLLVLQGGMAAGSATWGAVAARFGVENAMWVAATALVAGLLAIPSHPLRADRARLETSVVEG